MNFIVLGEYTLDLKQGLLLKQQQEVAIEPKAFALLLYLYQHRERYVSLEELHQQVWTDRVVSDSAVRSCIKKLRIVLDDHDVSQPRYIKSVSKRGYKLVCPVSEIDAEPAMETATAADTTTTLPTLVPDSPTITIAKRPAKLTPWLVLSGVALALLWLLLQWIQAPKTAEQLPPSPLASELPSSLLLSGQHISTPAGEKRGLAVSPDGTHLAFIGRPNQSEPWQIYLMNRQSRDIRLLPAATQQPNLLVFDENQSLFVVDLVVGDSAIYRLQLNEDMQLVGEEKVVGFPLISHLSPAIEKGEWLINAADDVQGAVKLYRWHADTDQLQLLQARSSVIEHIYHSVYSPSGRWLASAVFINGDEFRLEVQDLQSKRIVYSEKTAGRVRRLEWFSEESLIKLDNQGLVLVELVSNSQQVTMEHGEAEIEDVALAGSGQQLLLLRTQYLSEPVFQELALGPELSMGRIIQVPHGVQMINYAETDQGYFGVVRQQDKRMLVKYDQLSSNKEVLFITDKHIEILEHHPAQNALLLQAGQQLIVLDLNTSRVDLVSTSQSFLDSHAAFSLDGYHVYYGQLITGEWELYQFERASQRSRKLLKGYRSLREIPDGFIAATDRGELYQLDQQLRPLKSLEQRINTEFISRWYIKQQKLIWSDFDFVSTWLNQLNLDSGEFHQTSFPYEKMWPRFAINQDGSHVLAVSRRTRTTNLVEVDLPAQFFTP